MTGSRTLKLSANSSKGLGTQVGVFFKYAAVRRLFGTRLNYSQNVAQILLTQRATVGLFRTKATQRTTATGMMLSGRRQRTSRKTKAGEVAFRAYLTNKEVSLTATVVMESIAIRQRQDRPVAPLNSSGERVTQGGTTTAERPRVHCPSRTGSNDRILLWAQCNHLRQASAKKCATDAINSVQEA